MAVYRRPCGNLLQTDAGGSNALYRLAQNYAASYCHFGSFSLFRGLAEAITRGVDNFTGFPASFLFLGQGYLFGVIPAQLPILL